MNTTSYWHKLSKYLMIKSALPHLLLGVIAAGFSFSDQNSLSIQTNVTPVSIIAITAMVQERHATIQSISHIQLTTDHYLEQKNITPVYADVLPSKAIRLTPYNGIRAGPITTA